MIPENAPWFKYIHRHFDKYQTFDLLTSVKRFSSRMIDDEELYRKNAKRGKKIRIMIERPLHDSPILPIVNDLRKHQNFEIRYIPIPPKVILIIIDQKEVALAISPSNRVGPPYLVSSHPSFVHMAQQHFEARWNEAAE